MRAQLLILAALVGCTEYEIKDQNDPKDDVEEGEPDIEVTPGSVDFGDVALDATEFPVETITVNNLGTATLEIRDMYLQDSTLGFDYTAIGSVMILPNEPQTFTVSFVPTNSALSVTNMVIESNDPDEANANVQLSGQGIAPLIDLSPEEDDFGTQYVGCELRKPLTISNLGNADLIVSALEYTTASGDELTVDLKTATNGELPWTIGEGASVDVEIVYSPLDDADDDGFLTVTSNDPERPEAKANQVGDGAFYGENADLFEQPIRSAVDLLWVIDNSGSMSEEQMNLANNAEAFITTMVAADSDYHIAVITTDNPDFRDEFITSEDTSGAIESFVTQATPGTGGSGDEAGSEMAAQCFDGGDCVETDFLRDDARLQVLYVTDETDSSTMFSGWDWSEYVDFFQELKDNPDDVVINAIAGDYPTGCATASPASGYYEQTVATDGLFLSICATDWADYLTTIGEEAAQQKSSFVLTELPVPETIAVVVDGINYYSGWAYDSSNNAVQFEDDSIPAGGSTIEISYALYGDCDA